MSAPRRYHILVIDDDPSLCEMMQMLMSSAGYEVSCADDGFKALLQMKVRMPDLIVSDLNMPNMSGFELLSVVRRRFPQVAVVAVSGAYDAHSVPSGVIADAFFAKGQHTTESLLETIRTLLETSASRARIHAQESAPVWIPRNGRDANGIPYIVVTCTECLRSFPVHLTEELVPEVRTAPCVFCSNEVQFILGSSFSVAGVQNPAVQKPASQDKDVETPPLLNARAASN